MGLVLQSNGLKAEGKSYLDMSIDSNAYNPVINRQTNSHYLYPQTTVKNKHYDPM